MANFFSLQDGNITDPSVYGYSLTGAEIMNNTTGTMLLTSTGLYSASVNSDGSTLSAIAVHLSARAANPNGTLELTLQRTASAWVFLDSSSNNLTITPVGTAYQNTFTPFSPNGWSAFFNGFTSSSYLNAGSNSAFSFGTGNYTVEMWIYSNANTGTRNIISNDATGGFNLYIDYDTLSGIIMSERGVATILISQIKPKLNEWTHIAICRSGTGSNQTTLFINGSAVFTGTNSKNWTITGPLLIGAVAGSNYFFGYISNVRILKGTALYTANFTPSTSRLTNTGADTSLLTLQDNRFKDNSNNNFTLTANGSVLIKDTSPFTPVAVDPAVHGGSLYINGSEYLTTNTFNLSYGTGNFTIEFWMYPIAYPTSPGGADIIQTYRDSGTATVGYNISLMPDATFSFPYVVGSTYYSAGITPLSSSIKLNEWTHMAVVRNGNTVTIFKNGSSVKVTTGLTGINFSSNSIVTIGKHNDGYSPNGNDIFKGYISNLRAVGTALYTSNFTPSASPLTNVPNTSLLLNTSNIGVKASATETYAVSSFTSFDGSNNLLTPYPQNWQILKLTNPLSTNRGDVINYSLSTSSPNQLSLMAGAVSATDTTGVNKITTVGSPLLTSYKPYPNFDDSLYLNGSTDWVAVPPNPNFNLAGDFTIECWVTTTSMVSVADPNGGNARRLFSFGVLANNNLEAWFYNGTSGSVNLSIGYNTTTFAGSIVVANSNWHHIAVVRYNGALRLYVDGQQSNTPVANATVFNAGVTSPLSIGSYNNTTAGRLSGYINQFRIVNGTAVYTTSAFTPPTTPLTNIPNTVFLMKNGVRYDQALISNTNINTVLTSALTINGTLSTASPFGLGNDSSILFNSASQNISIPNNSNQVIGSNPFTIEFWWYPNSLAQFDIFGKWTGGNSFVLQYNNPNFVFVINTSTTYTFNGSVNLNSWNHIVLCKDSTGNGRVFVNGVSLGTQAFAAITTSNTGTFDIAKNITGRIGFTGHISNFRFLNGVGLYVSNFTPPTKPLDITFNTSVLLKAPYYSLSAYQYNTSSTTLGDFHVSSSLKGLITESSTIQADTFSIPNLYIHNRGTLTFPLTSSKTLTLNGSSGLQITSHGTVNIGTISQNIPLSTTHTLILSNTQIDVHKGGNLNVYGYPRSFTTNLVNDTVSGSRTFTTVDNISSVWNVGDTLVFKPNLTFRTGFDTLILSSFTESNTFTTTSASVFTHTGSATYANIAGVYNLNRNVIIQGLNLTNRGTIRTIDSGNININYASLSNFGINTINKTGFVIGNNANGSTILSGIVINSDNTSTVNNIAPLTGRAFQNTTITNNIIYKSNTIAISSLSANNVTVSNNYILSSGGIGLQISNLSGSINMSNNTTIGSQSYGTYLANNTLTGTYGANNFNSGAQGMYVAGTNTGIIVGGGLNSAKEGVYVDTSTSNLSGVTFQNILANNNSSVGFKVSGNSLNYLTPVTLNINGLVANTNLDNGFEGYNITGNLSSLTLNNNVSGGIRTSIGNGPTTFNGLTSILSGIPINILSGYNYSPTILKNTLLSSNSSVGIRLDSTRFSKFSLDNSTISAPTPIQLNSTRNLIEGSYLFNNTYLGSLNFIELTKYQPFVSRALGFGFTNYNKISANNFTYLPTGTKAIDTVVFDSTTSDQVSERLTPISSTSKLRSSSKFVALNAGDTTIVRVNVLASASYNGKNPRLMLKRNPSAGIYDDTLLAPFPLENRDVFSVLVGSSAPGVSAIPKVLDNCVLEFYVDCDGTTGYVCVDTWSAN